MRCTRATTTTSWRTFDAVPVPGGRQRGGAAVRGGLLGHWSVWTHSVVKLYEELREYRDGRDIPAELLARGAAVTDCNGVFFDVAHNFAGCIPGVHEVLRRQGLMAGTWCLDPDETLSEGQEQEIDRVYEMYPHLNDDARSAWH
ncbi:MAG: hypothetical protein ACLVEX_04045 [Ruthenibacterium lactatiformans]